MKKRLLLGVALLAAAVMARAEDREVILNENCYWRTALLFGNERVSPELAQKGPSKWISQKVLTRTAARIKKNAKDRRYKHRYKDFSAEKWHEYVYVRTTGKTKYAYNHGLTHEKLPLPANWMAPDFDDLDWPRVRNPHLMGTPPIARFFEGYCTGRAQLNVGKACYRSYFELLQSDKADLRLSLTYRGGVRIFLDGQEILRKHLPAGKLNLKAVAEGYPPEAYVMLEGEGEAYRTYYKKKPDDILFWADLHGPFKKPGPPHKYRQAVVPTTETVWNRVQRLRDRKIEDFKLPVELLKKGANCLAIEVFRSDLHPVVLSGKRISWGGGEHAAGNLAWSHGSIPAIALTANKGTGRSGLERPAGVRVWAEDIHSELYPFDYLEPGAPAGALHAVGPRNGAVAAMLIVGTDKDLSGIEVAVSDLKNEKSGNSIPGATMKLFSVDPRFLNITGFTRSFNGARGFALRQRYPKELPFLEKYHSQNARGFHIFYVPNKLSYIERLQPGIVPQVKKDTIQPYWIALQIPKDAKAGNYAGTVTITGQGMPKTTLPITVEAMAWVLPDPAEFQTFVGIEQNPYGVAKQYKAKLWSDEHLRLIGESMKQLARVDDDWLNIPCVRRTQYGNRDDQMIRWIRKKDGKLTFDFSVFDKYLDLAVKHWGAPKVVNLVVVPGNQWDISVNVFDEKAGKDEVLQLCEPKAGLIEAREADWTAFAKAVYDHMKARKLWKATYWGYRWDYGGFANLPALLAEAAPEVYWARAPHHFGIPDKFDRISTQLYGVAFDIGLLKYGWKSAKFHLFNGGCRSSPINDNNPPHVYRTFVDTGLMAGLRGIAQVGGDHWEQFGEGFKMGVGRYAGFSPQSLLYPGKDGAVSSLRYEALLQGLQEAEARIVIEQAIENEKTPDALKKELKQALESYANEKAFSFGNHQYMKENHGWMNRARIIYNAAAKAAKARKK